MAEEFHYFHLFQGEQLFLFVINGIAHVGALMVACILVLLPTLKVDTLQFRERCLASETK